MPKNKPVKIENLEGALAKIPEADRDALRKDIEKLFADVDPDNPPGRPVFHLTGDEVACPACGAVLKLAHKHTSVIPDLPNLPDAGQAVEFSECDTCEQPFMRAAVS